jgi:hypothetical protein
MLADDFVPCLARMRKENPLYGPMAKLGAGVHNSARFSLSPETMAAAYQLTHSRPSSVLSALPMCRPGFDFTWFEWDGRIPGRPDADEDREDPGIVPSRIGCFIRAHADNPRYLVVEYFWKHYDPSRGKEPQYTLCPVTVMADIGIDKEIEYPTPDITAESAASSIAPSDQFFRFRNDPEEMRALAELNRRVRFLVSMEQSPWLNDIAKRHGRDVMKQVIDQSYDDVKGEARILFALLALLNSRNCVEKEPADLSKQNKLRRLRGKPALLSYSTVKINLSKADARRATQQGATKDEIRRHIVRGHFKLRKGGVFWWRPFLRGNPALGEVKREGFVVTGSRKIEGTN